MDTIQLELIFNVFEIGIDDMYQGILIGYKKSQETHPFSQQDMIDFVEWCRDNAVKEIAYGIGETQNWELRADQKIKTTKELLQMWEEESKTIYYDEIN